MVIVKWGENSFVEDLEEVDCTVLCRMAFASRIPDRRRINDGRWFSSRIPAVFAISSEETGGSGLGRWFG